MCRTGSLHTAVVSTRWGSAGELGRPIPASSVSLQKEVAQDKCCLTAPTCRYVASAQGSGPAATQGPALCLLCSKLAMCITRGAPGWCCPTLQRGLSAFSSATGAHGDTRSNLCPSSGREVAPCPGGKRGCEMQSSGGDTRTRLCQLRARLGRVAHLTS